MKKNNPIIAVLVLLFSVFLFWGMGEKKIERELSEFADSRENFPVLLDGYASFKGDTVFFNLLSSSGFRGDRDREDVIIVKMSSGESVTFSRGMVNQYSITNPGGEGKAMKAWTYQKPELIEKDSQEFLVTFLKVTKYGKYSHDFFKTQKELENIFIKRYSQSPSKAKKMAKKFTDPSYRIE